MCGTAPFPWQGEKADCFYIVESGEVKIMMKSKVSEVSLLIWAGMILWFHCFAWIVMIHCSTYITVCIEHTCYVLLFLVPFPPPRLIQTKADQQDNAEVEITRCASGQYFGELALVTNKPRAASVYAVGEVKCLGKCVSHIGVANVHVCSSLVHLWASTFNLKLAVVKYPPLRYGKMSKSGFNSERLSLPLLSSNRCAGIRAAAGLL